MTYNNIKFELKLIKLIKLLNINLKALNNVNSLNTKLIKKTSSGSVKSAIEGVVFINVDENSSIFIGELIEFIINRSNKTLVLKGMVIGLSIGTAEIMLFGDTSEIAPGDI
jgi:hypothetical protein